MPHRNAGTNTHGGRNRHVCHNENGQLCMTVVDPATRKLLIPVSHIYETRAQHRNTLPSLCQLFLTNRCRQGSNCYQVHANWEVVEQLRSEVDALPCCCVRHGDPDRAGVCLNAIDYAEFMHVPPPTTVKTESGGAVVPEGKCLADVALYLPNCSSGTLDGQGCIALTDVSYTVALKKLLEEQDPLRLMAPATAAGDDEGETSACRKVIVTNPQTGELEEKFVVDGTGCTVCRLHALDRCRYAEECKFLHLCKDITSANPALTQSATHHASTTAAAATAAALGAEGNPNSAFAPALANDHARTSASLPLFGTSGADLSGPARSRRNPRQPQHNYHGGSSIFTTISRQQQQQLLRSATPGFHPTQLNSGAGYPGSGPASLPPGYAAGSSPFGVLAGSLPNASSSFFPPNAYFSGNQNSAGNGDAAGSFSLTYNGMASSWASQSTFNNSSSQHYGNGVTALNFTGSHPHPREEAACEPFPSNPMAATAVKCTGPTPTPTANAEEAAVSRRPALLIPQCEVAAATGSVLRKRGDGTPLAKELKGSDSAMDHHMATTSTTTNTTTAATTPLMGHTGTASSTPNFHTRGASDVGSHNAGALFSGLANPNPNDIAFNTAGHPSAHTRGAEFDGVAKSYPSTFNPSISTHTANMADPQRYCQTSSGSDTESSGKEGLTEAAKADQASFHNIRVVVNRRGASLTATPASVGFPGNAGSAGLAGGSQSMPTGTAIPMAGSLPSSRTVRTWQHNPYNCMVVSPSLEDTAMATTSLGSLGNGSSGSPMVGPGTVAAGLSQSRRQRMASPLADFRKSVNSCNHVDFLGTSTTSQGLGGFMNSL